LTKDHLAVDWLEGGTIKAGLLAKSTDGVIYEGFMGFPSPDLDGKVVFRVYKSKDGEVLLFGEWWRLDANQSSSWLIRLAPVKAESNARKTTKSSKKKTSR